MESHNNNEVVSRDKTQLSELPKFTQNKIKAVAKAEFADKNNTTTPEEDMDNALSKLTQSYTNNENPINMDKIFIDITNTKNGLIDLGSFKDDEGGIQFDYKNRSISEQTILTKEDLTKLFELGLSKKQILDKLNGEYTRKLQEEVGSLESVTDKAINLAYGNKGEFNTKNLINVLQKAVIGGNLTTIIHDIKFGDSIIIPREETARILVAYGLTEKRFIELLNSKFRENNGVAHTVVETKPQSPEGQFQEPQMPDDKF